MMMFSHLLKISVLTLALATLCGCALSPQRITLAADIPSAEANIGGNAGVIIEGRDARNRNAFGTRGGVYPDTALIVPDNNLDQLISSSLTKAFQQRGFNALNPTNGSAQLDARLVTLNYTPSAGSVVNQVDISAVLEVTAQHNDDTLVREYRHSVTHRQPFTPTANQNQRMINDALNHLLNQLVNDSELLVLLGGKVETNQQDDDSVPLDVSPVPESSPLLPVENE